MISSSDAKNAVFHCFMGKLSVARKISDAGHFVSVPASVVFNSQVQEIAKAIDINSLVAETDAPFLSPFKGKRNEPAFVVEAVKKIAELKRMKLQEAEEIILQNSEKILIFSA
jgi:TatD DNase family protein